MTLTEELKKELLKISQTKNDTCSDRNIDYTEQYTDSIIKMVFNSWNRERYIIWDFAKNKKANLNTKEYNHLKGIKPEYIGIPDCLLNWYQG